MNYQTEETSNSSFNINKFLRSRSIALDLAVTRGNVELEEKRSAVQREQRFSQRIKNVELKSLQEAKVRIDHENNENNGTDDFIINMEIDDVQSQLRHKRTELRSVLENLKNVENKISKEKIEAAQEKAMKQLKLENEKQWKEDAIMEEKKQEKKSLELDEEINTLDIIKESLEQEYNRLHQETRSAGNLIEVLLDILRGKGYKKLSVDRAMQFYNELKDAISLNQFSVDFLRKFMDSHQEELGITFDDLNVPLDEDQIEENEKEDLYDYDLQSYSYQEEDDNDNDYNNDKRYDEKYDIDPIQNITTKTKTNTASIEEVISHIQKSFQS